jgi:hypothetical protein
VTLREKLNEATFRAATAHGGKITLINVGMPLYDLDEVADAAILALREWLEEQPIPEPGHDPWDSGYRACMESILEALAAAPAALDTKQGEG